MRLAFLLPLIALAACNDGAGNTQAPPVAAFAAPAGQDWTQTVAKTAEGGFVMGNPNAPIKLVEYGSRTCPACGAFGKTGMRPLEEQYVKAGKVSYEFRDFLIHAPDLGVALLGRCVGEAAFFPVLEQMFVEQGPFLDRLGQVPDAFQQQLQGRSPAQQASAWVEQLGYLDFVKQRGLPEPQARACLADAKAVETLAGITDDAGRNRDVTSTPTFLINGSKVDAVSWADVEQALKRAGA